MSTTDLMVEFSLSRRAAYRLKSRVHTTKVPDVGLRYLRADVEALFAAGLRAPVFPLGQEEDTSGRPARRKGLPPKKEEPAWIDDARKFGLW